MDIAAFSLQLKLDADIVEVARSIGISDARYGANICCPFHSESTPSFRFYENGNEPGSFKCFSGCGANDQGSDVFALVMAYNGIEFFEAVKTVAQVSGVSLPKPDSNDPLYPLRKAIASAQRLYRLNFADSPAYQYLSARGLTEATLEKFEFGYAAPGNRLTRYAKDLHSELIDLGLLRVNEESGDIFDSLYNRFTLPIFDRQKKVAGFGARVLVDGKSAAKYVNSQDSALFDKTQILFNLHRIPRKQEWCIVTEGYMDVVGLDQIGFPNTVSSMGTAITEKHIDQLSSRFEDVYFMFDGDAAGRKAAWRAAGITIKFTDRPVSFRFCFLPEGLDPFDIAIGEGPEAIMQHLRQGIFLSDYILQRAQSASDKSSQAIEERIALMNRISQLVSNAPAGLFQDQISMELSNILGCNRQITASVNASCQSSLISDLKNHVIGKFGDQVEFSESESGIRFLISHPLDG